MTTPQGEKKRKAVADAARKMAKAIEDLPNTSDEEKAELKRDLLNEEIQRLRALLADLLADCDNWGCAPDERYSEALR